MADAGEPAGKDMQEKPTEEFVGTECHLPLLVAVCVVFPPERHHAVSEGDQPVIGDSYAVSVPSQVLQNMFRTSKRLFRIHNPLPIPQLAEELTEQLGLTEVPKRAVEPKLLSAEQTLQAVAELASKYAA
jgi:hypothetical protein